MKTRTLKDGSVVTELQEAKTLKIRTKCPEKYMLTDLETGQQYIGYPTAGPLDWRLINHA